MAAEVTKLPSGLTIATDTMPDLESAAIGVWVSAGARYEEPHHLGVSHFLEHMAFKGTKKRSALEIVEAIEGVGGYLNAYTSREQTAYYARILKGDLALAIDVLSDILINSTFDANEIERERGVIIQEIGQCADSPEEYIFDILQEVAYPDQPMGRPILGTAQTVGQMSRSQLRDYIGQHYGPSSLWLVGSGAIGHEEMCALGETAFAKLPAQPSREAPAPGVWGGEFVSEHRPLEQAHIAMAFPGVSVHDENLYVAQIFSEILGGSMSSRLFQEVREKRGLCYSVYSYNVAQEDCGLFSIYTGTGEESLSELMPVLAGEIEKLTKSVTDDEIARAQAQAKAGILMSLENPLSRCEWIAKHLPRYGRVQTASELVEKIEAVRTDDLKAFAAGLMETKKPALAALGQIEGLESYDQFAARFGGAS